MSNLKNLNESIQRFEKVLELNEKCIDPNILEQLEEIFCMMEYNFSEVEEELKTVKEKLTTTEEELNKKKEIIWNNKDLRYGIVSSAFNAVNS